MGGQDTHLRKHVPFFYRVTETRVEVSENEEFWGTRAVVQ